MAEIFGIALPDGLTGFGGGLGSIVFYVLLLVLMVVLFGVVIYFIYQKKVYRFRVEVYENMSGGGYIRTFLDRARLVKAGDGGQEILYLKKKKAYRSAYGRKMAKNTFWFAVGPDGYWYNFTLGDLDTKTGVLDVEPVDADVRMLYEGIRKNMEREFSPVNNFSKYAPYVFSFLLLLLIIVGGIYIIKETGDVLKASEGAVKASQNVMDSADRVLGKIDNLQAANTGGLIPAT